MRAAAYVANTLHVGDPGNGLQRCYGGFALLCRAAIAHCLLPDLDRLLCTSAKMADAGSHPIFVPKINPDDHSAKIVLCGALMLPPLTMMAALGVYNRVRSKTLLQIDSFVTLLGTVCHTIASSRARTHQIDCSIARS